MIFFAANFVCTAVGTFADPVDCKNYVVCQAGNSIFKFLKSKLILLITQNWIENTDSTGKLVATFTKCKSVTATTGATFQYYYIPATTNNCVLPSTFTKDTTYYPTKTCTM